MPFESVQFARIAGGAGVLRRSLRWGATRTSASARVTQAGTAPRSAAHALAFETVYAENFAFAWRSLRRLGVAEDARR